MNTFAKVAIAASIVIGSLGIGSATNAAPGGPGAVLVQSDLVHQAQYDPVRREMRHRAVRRAIRHEMRRERIRHAIRHEMRRERMRHYMRRHWR